MFLNWWMNVGRKKRGGRLDARTRAGRCAALGVERLEDRRLLTSVPYGALPVDTGEFMLGDVLVTVVLMESSDQISSVNPNTENWRPETIGAAKSKVVEGMQWWEQTLATQFPNNTAPLKFHFDFTYADAPVVTNFEPIANPSTYFADHFDPVTATVRQGWIKDFLNLVGHNTTGDFSRDIRAFNHQQRLAHATEWAFTVFVVNDENDAEENNGEGMFAPGGFSKAFAYAGGQFLVSPAGRPASTFAHETGHMFWARDEYPGSASYYGWRGYYNSQNLNAVDGNPVPTSVFVTVQTESIMSKDYSRQDMVSLTGGQWQLNEGRPVLTSAWENHTSSASSLAMIGWQDSDGDGILDVLDVPFALNGAGYVDTLAGVYRFVGNSAVQTLPNRNSAGTRSDITINRIHRAEYRIDGGPWQTAGTYDAFRVSMDLRIPLPDSAAHTIEIRTVDDRTGVTSPVFSGSTDALAAVEKAGINGFLWNDLDDNGQFDVGERPISGWTVRLVDEADQPLNLMKSMEPDGYPINARLDQVDPAVTLKALVNSAQQGVVASLSTSSSTGIRVLGYLPNSVATTGVANWNRDTQLRADFASPVSVVRLDAIAASATAYARLEAYDANGNLLQRYTTRGLAAGQFETMRIERPTPDIAYVIAREHGDTVIQLDQLRFGIATQTTTGRTGSYHFTGLPAGSYRVQVVAPPNASSVGPVQTVTIGEGEAASGVNFVGAPPVWQNSVDPIDVNGDGDTTPMDVLMLINFVNAHSDSPAVADAAQAVPPYYDVNGDGYVTSTDVLLVINRLNNPIPADMDSTTIDVTGGGGIPQGEAEATAAAAPWDWAADEPRLASSPENAPVRTPGDGSRPSLDPLPARQARDGFFRDLAVRRSNSPDQPPRRAAEPQDLQDLDALITGLAQNNKAARVFSRS
ncbi:MAG: dockerin type I repeat-containing protein [Pirellulaceae bacterium]|nr:dockerin type I repeat-containing protein [Pirellulaceae bacterium]